MNYNEIVLQLMTKAGVPQNSEDTNFFRILPGAFAYADGRIYRDLDFLAIDVTQQVTLVAQERDVVLPENTLSVLQIGVCTPPGAITRNSRRHFPERISPEALDMFWPQANFRPGIPKKYAIVGVRVVGVSPFMQPPVPVFQPERFTYTARFMPAPDRAYTAEVYGSVEPQVLSQDNPETFLTIHYPELFMAAAMIWITGYQRDYGAQSDDPSRAVSWESQYRTLRDGLRLEIAQQRVGGATPPMPAVPAA
jgi:hypothetical protein